MKTARREEAQQNLKFGSLVLEKMFLEYDTALSSGIALEDHELSSQVYAELHRVDESSAHLTMSMKATESTTKGTSLLVCSDANKARHRRC